MDREASWATVSGVAKIQTRVSDYHYYYDVDYRPY